MSLRRLTVIGGYFRSSWRRTVLFGSAAAALIMILVQLVYSWNNLPLYQTIDGVDVGGQGSEEATALLNEKYRNLPVALYFGDNDKPYVQPPLVKIGVSVDSEPQVRSAAYPWWLRLVPTSLWWAHTVIQPDAPAYDHTEDKIRAYVKEVFGEECKIQPQNASLEYKDERLRVIPAIDGGTCVTAEVVKKLEDATPRLTSATVRLPMTPKPAKIHDKEARAFAAELIERTESGAKISAGGQEVEIPRDTLLSWLDFSAPDTGLAVSVSATRSADFFAKQLLPKVSVSAGTSRVTTRDFTEISRVDGKSGQTLDSAATLQSLNDWLTGAGKQAVAVTKSVAPSVIYTRTYTPTDTGMNALITQFAQSHPGTFGISFAELDGQHRHAAYRETEIFRTASTYKLFVAYGTLKRVEAGQWHWTDQIQGGRDLAKCLDDMIVKSDNPCGEVLLEKIGYTTLTNELRAIGLSKSSFTNEYPKTTAGDLTTFVGALQSGQLLNPDSTNRLLSLMKRNIYRQGIPAGASGTVANKVGFLDGLLHDAAIVYSPSGTYVLSIMTDGSSWATIAELTRKIEELRAQG